MESLHNSEKAWKIINSSYQFISPWLKVRKDTVQLRNGVIIPDFYVTEAADWVNVIAITKDGRFIIEEQYRHGLQNVCYELCAGMIEDGESPLETAKRELLEETGYSGVDWKSLGMSVPNASGSTIKCHHFLATNLNFEHAPSLEKTEEIKTHLIEETQLVEMMLDGRITEAVMLAPLWRYLANKK